MIVGVDYIVTEAQNAVNVVAGTYPDKKRYLPNKGKSPLLQYNNQKPQQDLAQRRIRTVRSQLRSRRPVSNPLLNLG